MSNYKFNIIKHIESQENKDIFLDCDRIIIKIFRNGEYGCPVYDFQKKYGHGFADVFYDTIYEKFITNKSQINNRIQYIKQSGYRFKEYQVDGDTLTIIME